jgi:hypothetical protein
MLRDLLAGAGDAPMVLASAASDAAAQQLAGKNARLVFLFRKTAEKAPEWGREQLPRESVTDARTMAASCGPSKDGQEADKGIDYGACSYASRLTLRAEKGGGALCPSPRRTRRIRRAHTVDHGVLGVLCSGTTRAFLAPAEVRFCLEHF